MKKNTSKDYEFEKTIAKQWDDNANARFKELNCGKDRTYQEVLCPVLYKLLGRLKSGSEIVDAGCGLGFFSYYMHERGLTVSGVDLSEASISLARKRFPYLKLYCENICQFAAHRNERFDAAIANMLFHNVCDLEKVIQALFNLVKPGGILVGCIPHPDNWFKRRLQSAEHFFVRGKSAYLTPFKIRGSAVHPALFTYFHRSCDQYWQLLAQVGFAKVQAVSFDKIPELPDDLIFFIAEKN